MLKIISTNKAASAIGPYSQAIKAGNMLFVSGQLPVEPLSSDIVKGDIAEQTIQVILNIKNILEEAGYSLKDVVKTTVFLKDLSAFQMMNEVYADFFTSKPARSTVEVSALPKGAEIEIEAIAVRNTDRG